jgi:hypothetical protein
VVAVDVVVAAAHLSVAALPAPITITHTLCFLRKTSGRVIGMHLSIIKKMFFYENNFSYSQN